MFKPRGQGRPRGLHCRDLKISNFEIFGQKIFFSSFFFLCFSLSFAERTKFLSAVVSEIEKI